MTVTSLTGLLDGPVRPQLGNRINILSSGGRRDLTEYIDPEEMFASIAGRNLDNTPAQWLENRDQYVKNYKGSVYIAIGAIARMSAMQQGKVKRRVEKKSGVVYENVKPSHPLCQLLENPNDNDTDWDLWFYMTMWQLLTGDSMLLKSKNGFGVPVKIYPMPSQWAHVITSDKQFISGYQIQSGIGHDFSVPRDWMVHIKSPNADWSGNGRYYGSPAIKAAATSIELEQEMWRRLYFTFKNFAPPGMVFTTEATLQPRQVRELWLQLAAQFAMSEHSGRPMVTHGGLKLAGEFAQAGQRELDYSGSLDMTLDMTMATMGVPKALVGMVEAQEKSTVESALWGFFKTTLDPLQSQRAKHLTKQLAWEFEPEDHSLIIQFPPAEVDAIDAVRKDMETLSKGGAVTPDEMRHELRGMEPMAGGIGSKPVIVSGYGRVDDSGDRTELGRAALASSSGQTSATREADNGTQS